MASVEISNIYKSFGPVEVIHGIDVEIADKELVVLVGPSGCGKSTLLRMIAGLEDITAGEIAIDDNVVNRVAAKDRNIAMVFQSYALYPHMTVYRNMSFGLRMRKIPRDEQDRRIKWAAETLELTDYLKRYPRQLSGGAAPACRHGPCAGARAHCLPLRRAALQPRRAATRANADGDPRAAPAAADHHDLRHPRSGGGDDARRPHRRHARRLYRADRRAGACLRPAGQHLRRGLHRLAGDEHAARHAGAGRHHRA